jgi:hypothetical protein
MRSNFRTLSFSATHRVRLGWVWGNVPVTVQSYRKLRFNMLRLVDVRLDDNNDCNDGDNSCDHDNDSDDYMK